MSRRLGYWLWWGGEALLAFAVILAMPTLREPSVPRLAAAVAGLGTAGVLFAILGGLRCAPGSVPPARRLLVGAKATVIVGQSLVEEVLWRLFLLGALAHTIGWPLGLLVSTAGFALIHAPRGRRAIVVHHLTGVAFGGVFLATGRLVAPAIAHAAYNTLVVLANERRPAVGVGR